MILASASPRRAELLERAGVYLHIRPANVDETRAPGESPLELVGRLATAKAHAAFDAREDYLRDTSVLGADTIVWTDDGEVLGKPRDAEDARRMLRDLSGRTHHVSTGVCLMLNPEPSEPYGPQRWAETSFVETTDVSFYDLADEEIDAYVGTGEPLDKAGAYGIQGTGRLLVREIAGDYYNVVGLPVARVIRELAALVPGGEKAGLVVELLSQVHPQ